MDMEKEIFNELQHLVRIANPEDFINASSCNSVSGHMRSAMEFLALECLGKSRNIKNRNTSGYNKRIPPKSRSRRRDKTFRFGRTNSKTEADQIFEILINSKQLDKKSDVTNLAKYMGFNLDIDNKDSRVRSAKKLAKAIASSSERIKRDSLSTLNIMSHNQTKGWFDIIRTK